MPNYRRAYEKGGCYFFTVNLQNRNSALLTNNISQLTNAFRKAKRHYPFTIDALVILPDHMHAVLTLPHDTDDFSIRWRYIKSLFSRSIQHPSAYKNANSQRRERGIWQKRFWEHLIRDHQDYINHIHYCYYNPIKHGYVNRVKDWQYSTFHRDVKRGLFPINWASVSDLDGYFGEYKS